MLHLLSQSAGQLKPPDVSARMLKKESGGFQYEGLQTVPWSSGEGPKPWDCKGCVGPALILKDLKVQQIHSFIWQVFIEYLECAREAVLVMNSQSRGRLEIRDQKSSGKQHLSCAGLGRSSPDLWPHLGGVGRLPLCGTLSHFSTVLWLRGSVCAVRNSWPAFLYLSPKETNVYLEECCRTHQPCLPTWSLLTPPPKITTHTDAPLPNPKCCWVCFCICAWHSYVWDTELKRR